MALIKMLHPCKKNATPGKEFYKKHFIFMINIKPLSLAFIFATAATTEAATYAWYGASGLLPNQVSSTFALNNSPVIFNNPVPTLSAGVLTIDTTASNNYFNSYQQSGAAISMPAHLTISAEVQLISMSTSGVSRTPAALYFTTQSGIGNQLWIGNDEIFFETGTTTRGTPVAVNTKDAFHTYRVEVYGIAGGDTVEAYQDDILKLTGTLINSTPDNGASPRVAFGDGASAAGGNVLWKSVVHNAAATQAISVPEPSSALLGTLGLVGLLARRRRN